MTLPPTRIRLLKGRLHYAPDRILHTASSGPVPELEELILLLERDGKTLGLGSVRINIAYLSGQEPAQVEAAVCAALPTLDWSQPAEVLLDAVHGHPARPPLVRALLDQTLHDGMARCSGLPLHALLSATPEPAPGPVSADTNQTLFWCDEATLLARATDYVARGFTKLKLRMGIAPLAEDLNRLHLLRDTFGVAVTLSGDVNGQWDRSTAAAALPALAALELDYLEQPLPGGDWDGLIALEAQTRSLSRPLPVMLDETLSSRADITRLRALGRAGTTGLAGHLKLVKCGGIRPLMAAARSLQNAGIRVMVGQMNEGALATAAIAHCAVALGTRGNELYGADGLIDDPASGLDYDGGDGRVRLPDGPGTALSLSPSSFSSLTQILEITP